jgi:DNA replication protein DnaC
MSRLVSYSEKFSPNTDVGRCLLYLYGGNGTGKTTLASWVGYRIIRNGYSVKYEFMNSIVRYLMDEDFNQDSKSIVRGFRDCDLLIVDEAFDKEKTRLWDSGKQLPAIETFLKERVARGKGTMFISNKPPKDIESQGFSTSIRELIERETGRHDTLLTFQDKYETSQVPDRLF